MFRLISKVVIIVTIALFSFKAQAYKNDFALKSGLIFAQSVYNSLDKDGDEIDQQESYAGGVHTSFSYKWDTFELGTSSRIILGRTVDLDFEQDGQRISGSGKMRTVDIAVYTKFMTPTFSIPMPIQNILSGVNISPWYGYFKIGPSWMLHTIELDGYDVAEEFTRDHKLTYEAFGGMLAFGLEEDTTFSDMNPVYLEVSLSAYSSYKVSLVDKSNSVETNILGTREADQNIKTFSMMFIIGMTLF